MRADAYFTNREKMGNEFAAGRPEDASLHQLIFPRKAAGWYYVSACCFLS